MADRPEWLQLIESLTLKHKIESQKGLKTIHRRICDLDETSNLIDAAIWDELTALAERAGIIDLDDHIQKNKMRCDYDSTVAEVAEELEFMIGGE